MTSDQNNGWELIYNTSGCTGYFIRSHSQGYWQIGQSIKSRVQEIDSAPDRQAAIHKVCFYHETRHIHL